MIGWTLFWVLVTLTLAGSGWQAWVALRERRLFGIFFAAIFLQVALGVPGLIMERAGLPASDLVCGAAYFAACTLATVAWIQLGRNWGLLPDGPETALVPEPARPDSARWPTRVMALLVLVPVLLLVRKYAGESGGWNAFRESSSRMEGLPILLSFFLGPLAVVTFRAGDRLLAACLAGTTLAVVAVVGTRVPLLTGIVAILVDAYWIRGWRVRIVPLALFGVAAFAAHVLGRIVRGLGVEGLLAVTSTVSVRDVLGAYLSSGDSMLLGALTGGESQVLLDYFRAFDRVRDFPGFGSGSTLVRSALVLIPSVLVSKPVDVTTEAWMIDIDDSMGGFGEAAFTDLLQGDAVGSIHFTLWGDSYVNLGALGLLVYPALLALGLLTVERAFGKARAEAKVILGAVLAVSYAALARGAVVNAIGWIAYLSILYLMLVSIGALVAQSPPGAADGGRRS